MWTFWRKKWQPTPAVLPGETQGQRSQGATVYEISQTPLSDWAYVDFVLQNDMVAESTKEF